MKTVTLEEHFFTESYLQAAKDDPSVQFGGLQPKLLDLGAGRIAAMDEAGIDLQVLSLAAFALEGLDAATGTALARDVNDELAAAVKDPEAAVVELERSISQLGFVGLMLNGTVEGRFMDDPAFLPVFEAAARLGVPVYLHPAPAPKVVKAAYFSGLPGELGNM